jgi:hypothetical protein
LAGINNDYLKNTMNKNDTALLVISCDKYADLWEPFLYFFNKNWPDCPLDKYFIANEKSVPDPHFKTIQLKDDISWSDNLIKALNQLQQYK